MPHFFFHIRDGDALIVDEEGVDFSGVEDAVADAREAARDMIDDALAVGAEIAHQVIEITSPDGSVLEKVHLAYFVNSVEDP